MKQKECGGTVPISEIG